VKLTVVCKAHISIDEVITVIFERLRALIAEQFSVSEDSIDMDTSFTDDLGADSLDVVELTMALEEEFDIPETDEEVLYKLVTVGDVFKYISSKID
jgi:acyl carrier protein